MLASLLFPYDEDAPREIEHWLRELEDQECIVRYMVAGDTYLQITNWLKHQKIDRPTKSRLPQFDGSSRLVASPREDSTTDLGPRTVDLGPSKKPICASDAALDQREAERRDTEYRPPDVHPHERREDNSLKDRFDRFWKAYPKKKSKGDAEKAWKQL
ncbi:MAG: hypothetical protein B7X10_05575, partial [Burkholderiales bacterium 21-58-4]